MAENIVYLELLRRGYDKDKIFYFKDEKHRETDFVIREDQGFEAIQVCWNIGRPEVRSREIKGLLIAMEKFNLKEGLVLDGHSKGEEKVNGKLIKIMPLDLWLLNKGKSDAEFVGPAGAADAVDIIFVRFRQIIIYDMGHIVNI